MSAKTMAVIERPVKTQEIVHQSQLSAISFAVQSSGIGWTSLAANPLPPERF
jgi:hypothetical protein